MAICLISVGGITTVTPAPTGARANACVALSEYTLGFMGTNIGANVEGVSRSLLLAGWILSIVDQHPLDRFS